MFQPGQSGNPNGRKPGVPNNYSLKIKNAFALLLEDNLDNMNVWLHQVAQDDPATALKLMVDISQRFVPKLSQQAITDGEGNDLFKQVVFQFGKPEERNDAA